MVIRNGRVITPHGMFDGGLGVNNGQIVIIAKDPNLPAADLVIDAKGKMVLPGLMDVHVHFPGTQRFGSHVVEREGFETGTKAAAAGGVTTIFDMPLTTPAIASVEAFERRMKFVKDKAVVDYALYGGAGTHNVDEIEGLAKNGAIAYKTFMKTPVEKERKKMARGTYVVDDASHFDLLRVIAKTGLPSCVHAENISIIKHLTEEMKGAGLRDYTAFARSRPNFTEAEMISRVIYFSTAAGARVHISHMSTKEGVRLLEHAKIAGLKVTAETCPHYLLCTKEMMKKVGAYAKVTPPLRTEEDSEELWRGLNTGSVDIVTTDHAPYPKEEKDVAMEDFWKAPSGTPGIEIMASLMLTQVNRGKISLGKLAKVTSEAPAKIFGIYPKKGVIQLGSDADLVVVDLKREAKIRADKLLSFAGDTTMFDGWGVKGLPVMTIVRGTVVMKDGVITGKPGYGEFISPKHS